MVIKYSLSAFKDTVYLIYSDAETFHLVQIIIYATFQLDLESWDSFKQNNIRYKKLQMINIR